MPGLHRIVGWLNDYLDIGKFPEDQALNGLQVESGDEVGSVAVAVDACNPVFREAEADLLIVHHGLYWRGVSPAIKMEMLSRVKTLLKKKMSLYACHLPLDAHPEVGNNVQLISALSLKPEPAPGLVWRARFDGSFDMLLKKLTRLSDPLLVLGFGPEDVNEIYVCAGAGTSEIHSLRPGSTFITGEFSHYGYHYARERGINVVAMGHYFTESFGVKALGKKLAGLFNIPVRFIDFPTGM